MRINSSPLLSFKEISAMTRSGLSDVIVPNASKPPPPRQPPQVALAINELRYSVTHDRMVVHEQDSRSGDPSSEWGSVGLCHRSLSDRCYHFARFRS